MIGKQARIVILVLLGAYMSLLMFSQIEKSRRYKDIIKQSELRDQQSELRDQQSELRDQQSEQQLEQQLLALKEQYKEGEKR